MIDKYKINKMKMVSLFICINILLLPLILPLNHYKIRKVDQKNSKDFLNPIVNSPDIDIITPENKTYSDPMSGYYPATYGFESDKNGELPFGWSEVQRPTLTYAYVNYEKDNHKKVLKLNDKNSTSGGFLIVENSFEQQSHGTIEYWVRTTDISQYFLLNVRSGIETIILLYLTDGKWKCRDGANDEVIVPNMTDPVNNRWHHVQIDFECSGSGYKGLDPWTWKVNIDGRDSGLLAYYAGRERSFLNYTVLSTGSSEYNYDVYIDALGYSWDTNYQIGDNSDEGLLLSFENSTALEWVGYSLDSQSNKTIIGNTTISMPEEGVHNIQVFANNSVGTNFTSDIRYFTIDATPPEITINSPKYVGWVVDSVEATDQTS